MTDIPKLPLKRVHIQGGDYFRPAASGSPRKVFGEVTPTVRKRIAREVGGIDRHFQEAFKSYPSVAAVARVRLKDEALAKTHRPEGLFDSVGCPIVGIGGFGELLVSVTSKTISRLHDAILSKSTKEAIADISTIRVIEPYSIEASPRDEVGALLSRVSKAALKLRVFRHGLPIVDGAIDVALREQVRAMKIEMERLEYSAGLAIYRLTGVSPEHYERLSQFIGTQSLGLFPEFHVVRPASQPVGRLT